MANKKKRPQGQANPKSTTKPKQAAPVEEKEWTDPQYKWFMGLGALFFIGAMSAMFYSNGLTYGTEIYNMYQALAYGLTAIMGIVIAYGSKFNHTRKKLNIQMVGLVMFMIGAGKVVTMLLMSGK